MKKTKTILLWGKDDLLSSSVEVILNMEKSWKVINIPIEDNQQSLLQAFKKFNPDVVIMQQEDFEIYSNLITNLMKVHPRLKVITFSLNNNLMEVYSKQKIQVKTGADLISIIENGPEMHMLRKENAEF